MILLRFMSHEEFAALMNGETLTNETNHSIENNTNSKGFCFFEIDGETVQDIKDSIFEAYMYAKGIVSDDVAVVFDSGRVELNQCYGMYRNPNNELSRFRIDEYCTTEYSRDKLKPLYCLRLEAI